MELSNDNCYVKVAVRIRPLLKNTKSVIQHLDNDPEVIIVNDKRNIFAFDNVFRENASQNIVYEATVKPLITKVIDGFNCTILAYGQTGTGKTYTMGSDVQTADENAGLISRLLQDFFKYAILNDDINLSMSFIEIYNEKVYDLLSTNKSAVLNVKGFRVQNMTCVNIRDSTEAYHWLNIGSKIRHTGHTALNSNSSRSHAIFTLYFTTGGVTSKFHMVDLAGSESVRRTGTEGQAFREGITINKGLLTVGRVINALSNNDKVIPYRDSMLTTILQDSLNIKNHVVLLACVSPSFEDVNETLATLRFAEKTKSVKSRPQLETLASEFEKSHPGVFEKPSILGPTPFKKRKINNIYTLSTVKKKKPRFLPSFPSISPSFSLSNLQDNDTLSISTSTTIEQPQLSYSPLVKRCTEALQSSILQHLDSVVKTHLSITHNVTQDKENIDENIPWDKVENTITKIVKRELIQMSSQKPKQDAIDDDHKHINPRCALNFDDSPVALKLKDTPPPTSTSSPIFKMPGIKKSSPKPPRRSTRLSLLKAAITNNMDSPILFRPQRRSMRLSVKMCMTPQLMTPAVPTPAPRAHKIKTPPVPAPRKSLMPKTKTPRKSTIKNSSSNTFEPPIKIKKKKVEMKKSRKSVRSQHYDYILNILNEGSLKELQLLPTVGQKTAIALFQYRQFHGEFKNIKNLKTMPAWRGNGFSRFIKANHLESFLE